MIKFVVMLKKKAGMTRSEFIEYYENHHAKLVKENIPSLREYRRNYVQQESVFISGTDSPTSSAEFDVVSELWFDDMVGYQAMNTAMADPAIGQLLNGDAENLFDGSYTVAFLVDEKISNAA
jgi:uncharacterized protein (TIGR02118 family)